MFPDTSDVELWRRAKELFGEVSELDPAARAMRLSEMKTPDRVKLAVESLLQSFDTCDRFLADPDKVSSKPLTDQTLIHLERVGRYRLLRQIGSGGMGMVFEAEQDAPSRTVAVKVLHAFHTSDKLIRRFRREAEILARLDHPSIARVLESGIHRTGTDEYLYLAMELVERAKPITQYALEQSLGERACVDLMLKVCDAIHSAHTQGIIHRDVKPGNILVSEKDGQPKVIDFGVARIIESDLFSETLDISQTELVGSLGYMSPEQLGEPRGVDTRSDVYAIGIVLYELLSGKLPFERKATSVLGLSRAIESTKPRPLDATFSSDLRAIVSKALRRSPDDRYQSVFALSEDLRRYMGGEIVDASRDRRWYVIRKLARRHAPLVAAILAAAAVLGITASAFGYLYFESERNVELLRERSYDLSLIHISEPTRPY